MRRLLPLLVTMALAVSCGDAGVLTATAIGEADVASSTAPPTTTTTTATSPPTTTVAPATTKPPEPRPTPLPTIVEAVRDRVQTGGGATVGTAAARLRGDGTPTFDGDFADPFVLATDDGFYAYATNTGSANVPVLYASRDGGEYLGDALPEVPAWTNELWNWAPSVATVDDGYVMYYTTRHEASGRQCISVAVSDDPAGPFVDDSTEPLICTLEEGGSIDPSPFTDTDGTRWLLWKSDGNCCGVPTRIYAQPLTDDGLATAGAPVELIRNDEPWERDVVEGPSMIEVDGEYHLFYSANRWDTEDYAVGHAVCESVTGPCVKDPEPWLAADTDAGIVGPGGLEVVDLANDRADLVVYHGWTDGEVGYENGQRALFVEPIRWGDGEPVIVGSLLPA